MTKNLREQLDVLEALISGRKIKRDTSGTLRWEDNIRKPSLANYITSALFRAGLLTNELKKGEILHVPENTTGYVVLSHTAKTFYKFHRTKADTRLKAREQITCTLEDYTLFLTGGRCMKHILIILLLFVFCDKAVEPETVQFDVVAGNRWLEGVDVKIFNGGSLLDYGELPLAITANVGEVLVAHFEVYVSNFNVNYPQCDCEEIEYRHYKCTESKVVDGNDWEVAK